MSRYGYFMSADSYSEGELACTIFACPACNGAAGQGCYDSGAYTRSTDPHDSRVQLLRALRSYVNEAPA